jgi:hypothetical protein
MLLRANRAAGLRVQGFQYNSEINCKEMALMIAEPENYLLNIQTSDH